MTTALLTDAYETTMLQAALESGKATRKTTFELFARKLPAGRSYGVVGGVSRALVAVKNFRFTEDQINFLRNTTDLHEGTLDFLADYEFRGNISGYRDGELYFPYSPILTVEGTFADAVLLETVLLSILNHDSAIASAASRMVVQKQRLTRPVKLIEMGSRRTHESAAVASALCASIAGFDATSNLQAGFEFGVPTTGTSAHAFTLLHGDEKEAFANQVKSLGVGTTLLVDTYDTPTGIRNAIEVAGTELGGIRIDSGDLVEETFKARALLNELGAFNTKIVLSSDMDEWSINDLVEANAPVDGIGVGTRLVTGSGHPTAAMVYKLVAHEDDNGNMIPVAKRSSGKKSIGGKKVSYREYADGLITGEFFTTENVPVVTDIYVDFIRNGLLTKHGVFDLDASRKFHAKRLTEIPESAKALVADGPFLECVNVSEIV